MQLSVYTKLKQLSVYTKLKILIYKQKIRMSKQRYNNIQAALLQNQQDSSKNFIDKSKAQNEIKYLEKEQDVLYYKSYDVSNSYVSKIEELNKLQTANNRVVNDLLEEQRQKTLMENILSGYSEYKQEKPLIGESGNFTELQNELESNINNLQEEF